MKRRTLAWLMVLPMLLALSGCAAPQTTPAADTVPEASAALSTLLGEIAQNYEPGTAGCSLKAAKHAGTLLDWYAEAKPDASLIADAGGRFYKALASDAAEAFPEKLNDIFATAMLLCAEDSAGLLEDAGYTPAHAPWAQADAELFFTNLYAGMGLSMPEQTD